ncbi:MAG TPA: hypothetical protein VLA44_10920 [Clostridia bacterium]|nr:hypothetical protein [Clostridia bacterium]
MTVGGMRDGGEIEALVTDRYLESLLTLGVAGLAEGGAAGDDRLHPDVRRATEHLRRDLPRFHPSFRFEERVALRLAELAAAMRVPAAAGGERAVVPIAIGPASGFDPAGDPVEDDDADQDADELLERVRPLLIRGALTSAALSLAGAAYVAWRRNRPPSDAMARAVRAVARARLD